MDWFSVRHHHSAIGLKCGSKAIPERLRNRMPPKLVFRVHSASSVVSAIQAVLVVTHAAVLLSVKEPAEQGEDDGEWVHLRIKLLGISADVPGFLCSQSM